MTVAKPATSVTSRAISAPARAISAPAPAISAAAPAATLPSGHTRIFEGDPILVAYYGTAGTGALGVLGEHSPAVSDRRLRRQAASFRVLGRPIQPVYELIVSIADAYPGRGGDYTHDLPRKAVQRWINAAHQHGALLILDIQSGRSDFLTVAKRWSWALADPWVGLALDPEWRMPRHHGVPGRVIGHVDAREINRTSAWLAAFTAQRQLPEKIFMLHQFRQSMIHRLRLIRQRPGLAMIQHVDGYGTRKEKLATYHHVARPKQFAMGFKLFYDEDVHRMKARDIARIRPKVSFVSYQ
jgi:hypothetical protein